LLSRPSRPALFPANAGIDGRMPTGPVCFLSRQASTDLQDFASIWNLKIAAGLVLFVPACHWPASRQPPDSFFGIAAWV
jgi:hypothetical protein